MPSQTRIRLLLLIPLFFSNAASFEINLSFLTADDFKSGLRIAAKELAKQGLKSLWEINKFKGDVVGKAISRRHASPVSSRVAYSARTSYPYRWRDGVIPYVLSHSYDGYERAMIARAMQSYHEKTCIRFVPRTTERDYLKIGKFDGCFSDVGKSGGAQILSLDDGCIVYRIVVHELMHAIGFWHEHERPDRDDYVSIQWSNVQPGAHSQFSKTDPSESNTFGEPYDYRSLMHYDSKSFSRNGRRTMIATQPGMTDVMGKSSDLSSSDLHRLNALYPCSSSGRPKPVRPFLPVDDTDDFHHRVIRPRPRPEPEPLPPPSPSRPRLNLNFKLPVIGPCIDFSSECTKWRSLCHQPFISIPLKFACARTCGAC